MANASLQKGPIVVPGRPTMGPRTRGALTLRVTGARLVPGRSYDLQGAMGRIYVEHQLAQGSQGCLYGIRAGRGLGAQALKVLDLARTERQAVSLAFALQRRCAGPSIIAAQLMRITPKWAFVAFERAHGPNLEAHLLAAGQQAAGISLGTHLETFIAMAQAVAHCHSRGVVHRDIKPENFVFGQASRRALKLTDFGLATDKPSAQPAGTTTYMAPEALRGDPVGPAADVWSLGICLFRMVVGIEPHYDDDEALVAAQVVSHSPSYTPSDLALYARALSGDAAVVAAIVDMYVAATQAEPSLRPSAQALAQFAQRLALQAAPA